MSDPPSRSAAAAAQKARAIQVQTTSAQFSQTWLSINRNYFTFFWDSFFLFTYFSLENGQDFLTIRLDIFMIPTPWRKMGFVFFFHLITQLMFWWESGLVGRKSAIGGGRRVATCSARDQNGNGHSSFEKFNLNHYSVCVACNWRLNSRNVSSTNFPTTSCWVIFHVYFFTCYSRTSSPLPLWIKCQAVYYL